MAHITLSIPDEVYNEIKEHPEVKWSEVARASMINYLKKIKGAMHSKDLLELLSPEAKKAIRTVDEKKAKELHKKVVDEEWKDLKYSTRASR